ncbi:MAG TPA: hypothetical protein VGM23_11065 [Armatimonadota bacterium]
MGELWLTYAWEDNDEKDVLYYAQRLEQVGVTVKIDRWVLGAGLSLWNQIEKHITDPAESDAWCINERADL